MCPAMAYRKSPPIPGRLCFPSRANYRPMSFRSEFTFELCPRALNEKDFLDHSRTAGYHDTLFGRRLLSKQPHLLSVRRQRFSNRHRTKPELFSPSMTEMDELLLRWTQGSTVSGCCEARSLRFSGSIRITARHPTWSLVFCRGAS